jgi:uncharacterized protein YjiS (DUF1127 family)
MSISWLPARRDSETQLSQPTAKPLEKQMALDFAPAYRPVQSPVASIFRAVTKWVATRRAEHAQHVALQSLLFAPEHRLRDLGISREQLTQAMEIHRK